VQPRQNVCPQPGRASERQRASICGVMHSAGAGTPAGARPVHEVVCAPLLCILSISLTKAWLQLEMGYIIDS
jgi:hypothetical protein